nr:hypothetical protein [Tanacetum cinerariifolium]
MVGSHTDISHRAIWIGEERIPVATGVVDASLGMGETGENVIIPLRKSRRNAREADPRIPSSLGASLDTVYWMRIVNLQNVDQSFLYGVSDDVDTEYSSKSGNGLDLVGRLLGIVDMMRQKNKRMKQKGLIQHYGVLQKMNDSTRYAKEGNKINIKDLLKRFGATPPKITRKFKKASPSKKDLNLNLVLVDEEPKSSKKKVLAKKTTRNRIQECSGTVTIITPSAAKIKPYVINEGISVKLRVLDVTEEESSEMMMKIPNLTMKKGQIPSMNLMKMNRVPNLIIKSMKKRFKIMKKKNRTSDKDEEMDYTTSQLYADVDIRLNEPVHTDEGLVQKEDILTTEAEIVSPMDVPVYHEADPFKNQVTALDTRLGATKDEFLSHLSASITSRITDQVKIQLPRILPKEV